MTATLKYSKLQQLHAILAKKGLMDEKAAMVQAISEGAHTSSKDLSVGQLSSLISQLNSGAQVVAAPAGDKQRKHIISMAHEMGWKVEGGRADMQRINNWCIKYGHLHLPLNDYHGAELSTLVTTFKKKVYAQFINTLKP